MDGYRASGKRLAANFDGLFGAFVRFQAIPAGETPTLRRTLRPGCAPGLTSVTSCGPDVGRESRWCAVVVRAFRPAVAADLKVRTTSGLRQARFEISWLASFSRARTIAE